MGIVGCSWANLKVRLGRLASVKPGSSPKPVMTQPALLGQVPIELYLQRHCLIPDAEAAERLRQGLFESKVAPGITAHDKNVYRGMVLDQNGIFNIGRKGLEASRTESRHVRFSGYPLEAAGFALKVTPQHKLQNNFYAVVVEVARSAVSDDPNIKVDFFDITKDLLPVELVRIYIYDVRCRTFVDIKPYLDLKTR